MKKIIVVFLFYFFVAKIFAQKQTFDLATFTLPKGWNKQEGKDALQLSKKDATKSTYCLITLYKSIPAKAKAKENFDMAWASLVKEMVTRNGPNIKTAKQAHPWLLKTGLRCRNRQQMNQLLI